MSPVLPIALAAAAILLASIGWELHGFAEPGTVQSPGRQAAPALVLGAPEIGAPGTGAPEIDAIKAAQGWVATAVERPLFRRDRRPLRTATDAVLEADESLRLTGVIIGPFGNRAIFVSGKDAKSIVMVQGVRVGDLLVRLIEPGRAVIESGGKVRTLKPTFSKEGLELQR